MIELDRCAGAAGTVWKRCRNDAANWRCDRRASDGPGPACLEHADPDRRQSSSEGASLSRLLRNCAIFGQFLACRVAMASRGPLRTLAYRIGRGAGMLRGRQDQFLRHRNPREPLALDIFSLGDDAPAERPGEVRWLLPLHRRERQVRLHRESQPDVSAYGRT